MNIQTDKTSLAGATAVDIKRILQMIPHRYPMLMVDRVVDMQLDHLGRHDRLGEIQRDTRKPIVRAQ